MDKKLWALTRTEWAGQCTGFPSETKWLGIFSKKPDLMTIAPYLDGCLDHKMGTAIAQISELLMKGEIKLSFYDFDLFEIEIDKPIKHED